MEEFWKWMVEKNYAVCSGPDYYYLRDREGDWCFPTKHMLTGYYLDYCYYKGIILDSEFLRATRKSNVNQHLKELIIKDLQE